MIDSNPCFGMTHEKSMVVDDASAFIKSLNWETKNLTETRDYAIVTSHKHEVSEIIECFEADWKRKRFRCGRECAPDLVHRQWPGTDRGSIDDARHSIFLQNERYQDAVIIERLVRAAMPRRKSPRDGSPASQTIEGQTHRRRWRAANDGRCRESKSTN